MNNADQLQEQTVLTDRKRIIAAWNEEMRLLGHNDPFCEMMGQLQPWFERMVNEVSCDIES